MTSDGVSYTRNGETKSVKQALDELITKSSKVDELEKKVTYYENMGVDYLTTKAKVGDYVAYDAGIWGSNAVKPTEQGQFGGYSQGQSKNASSACYYDAPNLKGWRVLKKEDGKVYLVHASYPECYYHGTSPSDSVKKLNERAQSTYVDGKYAESAHALNYEEALAITGITSSTDKDLRATGDNYWIASATNDGTRLWNADKFGGMYYINNDNMSMGFRPVIVLKSDVLTTGEEKDMFGNKAWILA